MLAGLRLAAGDDDALADAFDRFGPSVYRAALNVLGQGSAAQDVVQDVFVELWSHPERFDPEAGTLRRFLVLLARRRSVDVLRSELRRIEEVQFPSGEVMTQEQIMSERWLPRRKKFPEWWLLMNGWENTGYDDLCAEIKRLNEKPKGETEEAQRTRVRQVLAMHQRCSAFDPFNYLTDAEQTAFEGLLKKNDRPLHP